MDSLGTFEILVKLHEKMLYAYLLGMLGDGLLAEEIAEEAFVKAYENLDTLKEKDRFPAWLRKIARNLALAEIKRRNRMVPMDPETIQGMEDIFGGMESGVDGAAWDERLAVVETCMKELPEKLQRACNMHYMRDMQVDEIAGQLEVNVPTILKRLERARIAIRQCVERKLGLAET
jgi:RNA polymerase sigma-70 factor, ECF subfamily